MLSILKFLVYALFGVAILTLVLSNSHPVMLELFVLPPIEVPLYAPVALAFAAGLGLGLLYSANIALRRQRPPKPDQNV